MGASSWTVQTRKFRYFGDQVRGAQRAGSIGPLLPPFREIANAPFIMPATSALLIAFGCALTHSLQLPAVARPLQLPTRHRSIVASVAEDPESEEARRARLEAIGREEAERNQFLDSAPADDGGLMAEFQARIDAEGGATAFKVMSNMNNVKEEASETARKAQVGRDSLVEGGERRGGGKLITRPRH